VGRVVDGRKFIAPTPCAHDNVDQDRHPRNTALTPERRADFWRQYRKKIKTARHELNLKGLSLHQRFVKHRSREVWRQEDHQKIQAPWHEEPSFRNFTHRRREQRGREKMWRANLSIELAPMASP